MYKLVVPKVPDKPVLRATKDEEGGEVLVPDRLGGSELKEPGDVLVLDFENDVDDISVRLSLVPVGPGNEVVFEAGKGADGVAGLILELVKLATVEGIDCEKLPADKESDCVTD